MRPRVRARYEYPRRYATAGGPNQVASASGRASPGHQHRMIGHIRTPICVGSATACDYAA